MDVMFCARLQRPLCELVSSGDPVQSWYAKLLLWYYEDQLKTKYAKFLDVVKVDRVLIPDLLK